MVLKVASRLRVTTRYSARMTLAEHFAYLGARAAELFFNLEHDGDTDELEVKLAGGVMVSTAAPKLGDGPRALAALWARHENIWVVTEDGFEMLFGRDAG